MRCVSTETWLAYAIVAETIACQEAMHAIVFAVDLGYVTMTPKRRVLRQGEWDTVTEVRACKVFPSQLVICVCCDRFGVMICCTHELMFCMG